MNKLVMMSCSFEAMMPMWKTLLSWTEGELMREVRSSFVALLKVFSLIFSPITVSLGYATSVSLPDELFLSFISLSAVSVPQCLGWVQATQQVLSIAAQSSIRWLLPCRRNSPGTATALQPHGGTGQGPKSMRFLLIQRLWTTRAEQLLCCSS